MEEEKTSSETENTGQSPAGEPTPSNNQSTNGTSTIMKVGFGIVGLLIVVALFLPPISLPKRLGLTGGSSETPTAVSQDPTQPATTAPTEEVAANNPSIPGQVDVRAGDTAVNVTAVAPDQLAASGIAALPAHVSTIGNVYKVESSENATGQVAVNLPADINSNITDLYAWDGSNWQFVPSQVENGAVVSKQGPLQASYALVAPTTSDEVRMSAEVRSPNTLDPAIVSELDTVVAGSLALVGNGDLQGEIAELPEGDYERYLHVTNQMAVVDIASLSAFLNDSAAQGNQINSLVNTAVTHGFAGINLDYQGVDASQQQAFTSFADSLANALHAQGRKLIITLGTPQQTNDGWNSGGQDWAALGNLADELYVQLPLDPMAYSNNGEASQLLQHAIRQIDRTKLSTLVTANAISLIGQSVTELSNSDALAHFGAIEESEDGLEVEPESPVDLAFTGDATPLEWDGSTQTYRFSYEGAANQTHHVWLGSPTTLAQRLAVANDYQLKSTAVRGLGTVATPAPYIQALTAVGADTLPENEGAAISWSVYDETGEVVDSKLGSELNYNWAGTAVPGLYTVKVNFVIGETVLPLDEVAVTVAEPVVEEEEEPEEVAAQPTATPSTPSTNVTYDPGTADAVVKTLANVRTGPGLHFGTIAGGAEAGTQVNIIGRNADSTWFQVVLPEEREGWMFVQVLEFNTALDISALEVIEVAGAPGGGGDTGGGPPPPVSAPPVAAGSFELGGQTHSFANPTLMSSAGMNWVKFQHKWGPGDDPAGVAGRISSAHAAGFKVLLSIPGSPYPTSIDFASYVEFLRGVASYGPDAIEIWNEMNIDFEWPAGQIDPSNYVNNMLAPAYNAIKSVNPNVMVISGAPAPTGFDNGTNAWSDARYMAGMAAIGAGQYADCIGAHFNAGATSPSQNTGHPAGEHYSWYLVPTLNVYAQLGKPVCFTELGYLSGEDYGGVPSRFSWAANTTVAQHAAWLAEAVSTAANTGKVRMIIVFNVDFTLWSDDPQAGYAMIRKDGSCPACSTLAQVMGR